MERILKFIEERPLIAVTAVGAATYGVFKLSNLISGISMGRAIAKLDKRPKHYEDGVIYLHTFPNVIRQHISMSPFAIKVETWLRLHKIPYELVETFHLSSSTAQIPYIISDGEEIADSNKIIQYLEKKFNIPANEGFKDEQQAISHCVMRTVDEGLGWTYASLRYMHYDEFFTDYMQVPVSDSMKKQLIKAMKQSVRPRFILHGIGRKTIPDIAEIGKGDICALSKYLGNKKFLMGDKITKVDCAVFAHLTQIVYVGLDYPHKKVIQEDCPNILPYADRVKNELWKDWDERVLP